MAATLDDLKRRQIAAGAAYLERALGLVVGQAQRIVPHREGTLGATGDVDVDITDDEVVATASFSTPYAARQHEEESYAHKPGRQAHYLEQPWKQALPKITAGLAAVLRRVTG